MTNNERLSLTVKKLCMLEPYYGLFLMQLNKEWTERTPTSGVAKNGINASLYINPMFWESLTELWRLMILKHDVLNIVFHHIEMADMFPDKDIMSLAGNIVCNQYIDPSWLPLYDVKWKDYIELNKELFEMWRADIVSGKMTREQAVEEYRKIPPRGVYLHDFPELKLEEKKGIKYYYDKLKEAKNKQPGKGGSSCLNELLKNKEDELPENWSKDWKEFEGLSEAEKKLLTSQIDYKLREIAEQVKKSRGTIPSELAEYIEALDKAAPPKFDWKNYLRRFAGGSQQVYTKKLHRKYNKRFEENPGLKIKPKRHIMLGIDTSGSVSKEELIEFFHEIYHIQKMGTEITVVQCDAAISKIDKYKRGFEDRIAIHGRGGTSFQPFWDYANEHHREFSALVIFTDGCAPAPEGPCKLKTLWVHSSKSNINEDLKGFKIKLEL